MVVTMATLWDK